MRPAIAPALGRLRGQQWTPHSARVRPARLPVRTPTSRVGIIAEIYQNRAEICACLYSPNGICAPAAGGAGAAGGWAARRPPAAQRPAEVR